MPPVIVVGAGPVGLGVALALSLHRREVILLEELPGLREFSRAPGLMARTLEIFREWGVLEAMADEGQWLEEIRVWVPGQDQPVARVDLSGMRRFISTPGVMILPQDRTEAHLLERVEWLGQADVRFGHKALSFSQDATGVTLKVAPRDGAPYVLRGAYLVGCDGAHSTVRHQLGWALEGKTYPLRMILADVRLDDVRDQWPWPRLVPLRRGALAALRLAPGLWRIIATVPGHLTQSEALDPGRLARQATELFGPGPAPVLWSSEFHIHCRTSPHFREGRVLLAGDAAHLNSPAGGQGMNGGLHDAHNLAWKLDRALGGGDAEALLSSYEDERRPVVMGRIDRYTDALTRLVLLEGSPFRRGALALARRALEVPALMSRLLPRIAMVDGRYERSALIAGAGPLLGCRAPEAELRSPEGRAVLLSELIGPEAVLLLFDDARWPGWEPDRVRELLASVRAVRVVPLRPSSTPRIYQDPGGSLAAALGAWDSTAVLLRPDGVVGWQARRPTPAELFAGVAYALGETPAPRLVPGPLAPSTREPPDAR